MKTEDLGKEILQKCDIYYGDALISREKILETYTKFFSSTLTGEDRAVSFALHTGSVCFDIIAIVVAALGCFAYSFLTNDDIIAGLNPGDFVIYKNERYRWLGVGKLDFGTNREDIYIWLEQDGSGKNGNSKKYILFDKAKHLIRPYYGDSHSTGGRGIRRKAIGREAFLSYIFEVPIEEIPSEIDISVVIVANRNDFYDIYRNLKIEYQDGRQIGLIDIVPAAYYTSKLEEYQYGNNLAKTEPVLKVTGKISTARDIVLNRQYNKTVGLLVTGIDSITDNGSELADLLRRKSLQFIHVVTPFKIETGERILEQYEDAEVFACTKEFLKENSADTIESNPLTEELNRQIENIINCNLSQISVKGWEEDDYNKIRKLLYTIKKSNWDEEKKNQFLMAAHGMLRLLITSFFAMSEMEHAIESGYVNETVVSPGKRLDELRKLAYTAGTMGENCNIIVGILEQKYQEFYNFSPKKESLLELLSQYKGEKVAVVVPKAYYSDILSKELSGEYCTDNVSCITANRFDSNAACDVVIAVGNITGKRFDPFQNNTANRVIVLLYACEKRIFSYQWKKHDKFEHRLNNRAKRIPDDVNSWPQIENKVNDIDTAAEEEVKEFFDFEEYIKALQTLDIRKTVSGNSYSGTSSLEVTHVGIFLTGEQILFSKNYSAVVFDREAGNVAEKAVDKLIPGDTLVFTKRDNYTKNIVDNIYENLLKAKRLDEQIIDATEKSIHWKEALREYKDAGGYSYRDIAKQLGKYGSTIKEVGVRQWLMEDSHVVGPREIKTLRCIAELTKDSYLLGDTEGCFEACRVVRHERREILKLIGAAINDKLSGNLPPEGSNLEIVYDNVDNLSEMYELDDITGLDETLIVSISLANRPITDAEVSM